MANHVCPWWMGYLLLNPARRSKQNPSIMLSPYIKKGMTVIDFGCGMGFFSLPLAELCGEEGMVISIDIQKKMLSGLRKQARKYGMESRIQPLLAEGDLGQLPVGNDKVDAALLFAVAHEVPERDRLFSFLYKKLKHGGILFFAEPARHIKEKEFAESLAIAEESGFRIRETVSVWKSHCRILEKTK